MGESARSAGNEARFGWRTASRRKVHRYPDRRTIRASYPWPLSVSIFHICAVCGSFCL